MQRRAAALATLILLSSAPAWAQTQQGVLAGLNLLWAKPIGTNTEALQLTIGNAWIDNVVVQHTANELFTANGAPVDLDSVLPATTWAASKTYYCYVTSTSIANFDANFSANTYGLICSFTQPNCDGTPSAGIKTGAMTGATTAAAFVGTFITDSSTNIIPFYRNGEEVVFAEPVSVTQGAPDTGIYSYTKFMNAGSTYVPMNASTTTLSPFCPMYTASSCIVDVEYGNSGSVSPSTTYILDPALVVTQVITSLPDGGMSGGQLIPTFQLAPQAQVWVSDNSTSDTIRLRINTDNQFSTGNNEIYFGEDDVMHPTITFVLRGYVEPIDGLCSRRL
jgi:hypothetical protein